MHYHFQVSEDIPSSDSEYAASVSPSSPSSASEDSGRMESVCSAVDHARRTRSSIYLCSFTFFSHRLRQMPLRQSSLQAKLPNDLLSTPVPVITDSLRKFESTTHAWRWAVYFYGPRYCR